MQDAGIPGSILHARSRQHHWHGRGALSIKSFVTGRALYRVGDAHFAVGEGEYLVLNSGQEYAISVDAATPVESFCVFFAQGLAEMVQRSAAMPAEQLLDDPERPVASPLFVERTYAHDDVVSPALARLRVLHLRAGDAGLMEERLHDLMVQLLRMHAGIVGEMQQIPAQRAATRDELYRRLHLAREYVAACFDQPIGLDDIARVVGMSPNHLLRTYREAFGETPYRQVITRRVGRAQELLAGSDMPITEICFAVGWTSLGSFSFLFHRHTGMSPREYRRQFGDMREVSKDAAAE